MLWRSTRRFDMRSIQYYGSLNRVPFSVGELLQKSFVGKVGNELTESQRTSLFHKLGTRGPKFCFRWRPMLPPSMHIWSQKLRHDDGVSGVLEVENPHLIITGVDFVREVKPFVGGYALRGILHATGYT